VVSRRKVLLAGPALAMGIVGVRAFAQQPYPTKLIKVVVGNAPGGTDDLISRFVVKTMQSEFGQTALVENRGGASTTIAGAAVASSPPDGYTILCLINTSIVQTVLKEKLPYSLKSFTPIIGVGGFPLALAVSPALKVTNFDEFKALAKSKDGVTYASGGVGTMAHLNTIRLLKAIDGHGTHVTYKNNPDGLQALAGGFTDVMLASASEVASLKSDGKLRVIAVTSDQRAVNLPDVPTMRELGYPTLNPTLWHGYMAPAGTPPDVVAKLADVITKAVRDPEFQARFKPLAFQEDIKTGDALNKFIAEQANRWHEVIVENNIRAD